MLDRDSRKKLFKFHRDQGCPADWVLWNEEFNKLDQDDQDLLYSEYIRNKRMFSNECVPAKTCSTRIDIGCVSLGCINATPQAKSERNQEKGNTMYFAYDDGQTLEAQVKNYLTQRSDQITWSKRQDLRTQFHMDNDEAPRTPKEFAKRIADGKFVIKGLKDERDPEYFCWYDSIEWRDPSVERDEEGYKAAKVELDFASTEAKDIIATGSASEGREALKALQAFKA